MTARKTALGAVMRLKGLAAIIQAAQDAQNCPATREAVEELEHLGGSGCTICGVRAALHRSEASG